MPQINIVEFVQHLFRDVDQRHAARLYGGNDVLCPDRRPRPDLEAGSGGIERGERGGKETAGLRKGKTTGEYQGLRNALDQWMGVRLYRDGFRVYPYGSENDDWLELDKTALASKGYALNRIQLVGQVEIGRLGLRFGLLNRNTRQR